MKYFKSLGLCLVAVFALSALAASAAQAVGGPVWIVGSGGTTLGSGETRAITSKNVGPFKLKSSTATIECTTVENTGFLLGGNPGTDYTKIIFKKCHIEGAPNCTATGIKPLAATNEGEVIVDALTILLYPKGAAEGESALDAFAPEGEEAHPNLFVEFKLAKNAECHALEGAAVKVEASGNEITIKTEKRKCGQLSQVGKEVAGAFKLTKPGEKAKVGLLELPETAITEASLFENNEFKTIKCELTAAALGTKVHEIGKSLIEIEKPTAGEEFGWNV